MTLAGAETGPVGCIAVGAAFDGVDSAIEGKPEGEWKSFVGFTKKHDANDLGDLCSSVFGDALGGEGDDFGRGPKEPQIGPKENGPPVEEDPLEP